MNHKNFRFSYLKKHLNPSSIIKKTAIALTFSSILGATLSSASTINSEFHIMDVEPVEFEQQALQITSQNASEGMQMSFYAYGQTFHLVLKDNNALMGGLSSKLNGVNLYAGKIAGVDNSWARITEVNGQYTGAIYDGYELYMLDSTEEIAGAMDSSLQNSMLGSSTAIYRASDVTSTATCGDHGEHHNHEAHDNPFSYRDLIKRLRQNRKAQQATQEQDLFAENPVLAAEGATEQLNLLIIADTEYVSTSRNGVETQVLSQMNIVDGIFSEQVGVQFGITEIRALSSNGSLTSTNPSTLLNQFRGFVGNNNPGLAHLFTGKNLDGSVIGIASLRAICTSRGVGVTQAGGRGTLGALTAAHEFGHNFGAPHDNQGGSACASSPGTFLMNPSINGSDQFSACSLTQIAGTLSRASCLVDVTPPTPTPTPQPIASCNFNANLANANNGFTFIDDAQTPAYTSSSTANGATTINVGGVDNDDINNMNGTLRRQCNADSSSQATIRVTGSLSQTSEYESNEFSQLILNVNGEATVLAEITGDGNGGPTQTTGLQEFTATVSLNSGVNTIDLSCFNNLKTFNNEVTTCSFTEFNSDAGQGPGEILNTDFNSDFGGFSFLDDPNNAAYVAGDRILSGGSENSPALALQLGGVDNADITNMVGRWTQSFNTAGGSVTLSLDANLTQTSEYESNEVSDVGVVIDGQTQVLNTIRGNGNGGGSISTGLQTYTIPLSLGAGSHTITLYCRNSEKTFNNETTTCVFDNVTIQ